jgi:hypothetical protein
MNALWRILLWILGAVLMVAVGILVIRFIKPLNNFVFGSAPGATSGA